MSQQIISETLRMHIKQPEKQIRKSDQKHTGALWLVRELVCFGQHTFGNGFV